MQSSRIHYSNHITAVLKSLLWLPVQYRITFKILLLVHKLNDLTPQYTVDLLSVYNPA